MANSNKVSEVFFTCVTKFVSKAMAGISVTRSRILVYRRYYLEDEGSVFLRTLAPFY
jgi:hypothetical protein